ncbi:MAG: hypothetical protein GVY09_16025 [Gammaproteobacteria bacterium]|jgi:Flp pilus assembly protein TadG|nr:hypothetical protein [Gammaproteobacteria bacterium]
MNQSRQFLPEREIFARDTRGMTAIVYALCLVPFMILIGFAVDIQRGTDAKLTVQSAIDSASLAAARMLQDTAHTDAEIEAAAIDFFDAAMLNAQGDVSCASPDVTIDRVNDTVQVAADCSLPTTFGSIKRAQNISLGANSTTKAEMTRLDLALMLDVSGSMSGQKLTDLKTAAKDAVDILMPDGTGDRVRIGFNPYAAAVNAGSYASAVMGPGWSAGDSTCATERIGWAAFKDDEPGASKWLRNWTWNCPAASVMPITNNKANLKAAIDGLAAGGSTAGHLGIAWAWYLIAPDWDDIWPADSEPLAYSAPKSIKAVILMTDGAFNTEYMPGQGTSYEQSADMCDAMKARGVIVYSVAFQAPSGGQAALQDCATSTADHYFNAANGAQLKEAYREIASQLAGLRLKQ